MDFDAVVLAGGAARRLGGADKPALRIGDRSMLDRVLAACADARLVVVVGPVREVARPVLWARESPAGGGPLAGLAAGVAALGDAAAPVVLAVAADLPHLSRATVQQLLAALGPDGACLVDAGGQPQLLAAAYRTDSLQAALSATAPHAGRSVRGALGMLRLAHVDAGRAAVDVDTPDDLRRSRVDAYVERLCHLLGVERDRVDVQAVLDLARDAAHHVERPAAPVTTYIAGLAAGLAGGGDEAVGRALQVASDLAVAWTEPSATSAEDAPSS